VDHLYKNAFNDHSKKCWDVLTPFWVKYGKLKHWVKNVI